MRRVYGAKVTRLTLGGLLVCREASGAARCREGWAEVSRGHSSRRTGRRRAEHEGVELVTLRSTDAGGAGTRAERPERSREVGGGTAEVAGSERQTSAARNVGTSEGTPGLLEEVLCRENVMAAYRRVVSNGGAAGVDGMRVEDLMPYCREHWAAIREELYRGTYRPQPVRRVSIPKPGGGERLLGIPTVLDEWIRRKLRVIYWRRWKRPKTRYRELRRRGIDPARARVSAGNGRGPWWNAGARHMNHAVPTQTLRRIGLVSVLDEHRRLQCLSSTAVYGTVCTVVWEPGAGDRPPATRFALWTSRAL